jgi:hypothetical protein
MAQTSNSRRAAKRKPRTFPQPLGKPPRTRVRLAGAERARNRQGKTERRRPRRDPSPTKRRSGKERKRNGKRDGKKAQRPEPSQTNRHLHAGRTKAHSALLTQLRTGKIGFSDFLYERRVPGVWSRRCACEEGVMNVRHVLLRCPKWWEIREEELANFRGDIKRILNTSSGATAAIRLVLRTGLLDQFKATACDIHAESRGKHKRGVKGGRSSDVGVP